MSLNFFFFKDSDLHIVLLDRLEIFYVEEPGVRSKQLIVIGCSLWILDIKSFRGYLLEYVNKERTSEQKLWVTNSI